MFGLLAIQDLNLPDYPNNLTKFAVCKVRFQTREGLAKEWTGEEVVAYVLVIRIAANNYLSVTDCSVALQPR